jgi:hypothetical protein
MPNVPEERIKTSIAKTIDFIVIFKSALFFKGDFAFDEWCAISSPTF